MLWTVIAAAGVYYALGLRRWSDDSVEEQLSCSKLWIISIGLITYGSWIQYSLSGGFLAKPLVGNKWPHRRS